MLSIDVVTIFPRMIAAPLAEGIVGRAVSRGLARVGVHDLRDYSENRHRTVDDAPFGGGPGMVMKPEPFFRAVEALLEGGPGRDDAVALLSPRGDRFTQKTALRYASLRRLVLLCGRYEGVDERVGRTLATEEISIGDYVLTGGEVAALAVIEATIRLLPGALGDETSAACDSFCEGLLDHPQYTRPAVFRGIAVPRILLSGDHARVRRWRRMEALRSTCMRRPDLLSRADLDEGDRALLSEIERGSLEARPALESMREAEPGMPKACEEVQDHEPHGKS
ncbi:MAG: tRNA (guanosine(37)-N1)-methyltransferase TrmD [Vicinamibacteria bacterium]|nr:tRNA (guanosine(37)-N1)-methyltransferase TrmD [Vicinamibacteria bacterium]